jgi:prophage maintenance system killer protein
MDVFPDDISRLCAMTQGIVSNHPFADGNKCVATAVLGATLRLNGV